MLSRSTAPQHAPGGFQLLVDTLGDAPRWPLWARQALASILQPVHMLQSTFPLQEPEPVYMGFAAFSTAWTPQGLLSAQRHISLSPCAHIHTASPLVPSLAHPSPQARSVFSLLLH